MTVQWLARGAVNYSAMSLNGASSNKKEVHANEMCTDQPGLTQEDPRRLALRHLSLAFFLAFEQARQGRGRGLQDRCVRSASLKHLTILPLPKVLSPLPLHSPYPIP